MASKDNIPPKSPADGNLNLSELIDIDELHGLCSNFTTFTGAATAILDLEGNILVAAGWHEICTRFHRINPVTAARCVESDTVLAGKMKKGERYSLYKCKNGMVDVALPITIDGRHVANFFTGQFFMDAPDKQYFARQAEEFGFDKGAYMDAVDRVPFFSDDFIKIIVEFLSCLTRLIGELGQANQRLAKANLLAPLKVPSGT
jgi:ligand-binding sensor protein